MGALLVSNRTYLMIPGPVPPSQSVAGEVARMRELDICGGMPALTEAVPTLTISVSHTISRPQLVTDLPRVSVSAGACSAEFHLAYLPTLGFEPLATDVTMTAAYTLGRKAATLTLCPK